MSESDKLEYMHASPSDIVKATVIFSVLMTLLGLNIVLYLICKYISRPRRNTTSDVKQVKRIKVKSASQISKDFEKESIRLLMRQLRTSSSRNLQPATTAVCQEEETVDFSVPKNVSHKEELTVNIESNINCENVEKVKDNITNKETFEKWKKSITSKDDNIYIQIDNFSSEEDKNTSKKRIINIGNKEGHSSNTGISCKRANSLKDCNKDGNKNTKGKNSKACKRGSNPQKRKEGCLNDLNLEDYSEMDTIETLAETDTCTDKSIKKDVNSSEQTNAFQEQTANTSSQIQTNTDRNIDYKDSASNKMCNSPSLECCHGNHQNNSIAITITAEDGLKSRINFGNDNKLPKS